MPGSIDLEGEYFGALLRHAPLGILLDVDGTLLPYKRRLDEVVATPDLFSLIEGIARAPGVSLALVSGRPRENLEASFREPRSYALVAEHGAWRTAEGGWEATLSLDPRTVDSLTTELERVGRGVPNARIERKTWSVAAHFRKVNAPLKAEFLGHVEALAEPWIAAHPGFEMLRGVDALEVRPTGANKSTAVEWLRARLGPTARLLILGDDLTDEDMFRVASAEDATIVVDSGAPRATRARWRVATPAHVRELLEAVLLWRASSR